MLVENRFLEMRPASTVVVFIGYSRLSICFPLRTPLLLVSFFPLMQHLSIYLSTIVFILKYVNSRYTCRIYRNLYHFFFFHEVQHKQNLSNSLEIYLSSFSFSFFNSREFKI